ncbi:MAG: DNA repair protein RecN [Porphyromonas sp.]|nr:DNA repair protein RecN [Porphyromonas sp.]
MIQRLYIKDFILIEEEELHLHEGFTTITGETGAGKSILIGAIGLILGDRADFRTIRSGAAKAIIEAECNLNGIEGIEELFAEHDLDFSPQTILRRELTTNGKSRAFINDSPVTTAVMKLVGERLVDIHSQHHNMLIGNSDFQMSILDTMADNRKLLDEYHQIYLNYTAAKKKLKEEERLIEEQRRDQDYITFQHQQLVEADLKLGEFETLKSELATAHHSMEIGEALGALLRLDQDLGEHESPLLMIGRASRQLESISPHFPPAPGLCERLETVEVELSELLRDAQNYIENLEVNPEELDRMEQRIDLIQGLLHKHDVSDSDELIKLRDQYAAQLDQLHHSDDHLLQLKAEADRHLEAATDLAGQLTQRRREAGERLLPQLHLLMNELGIAGATCEIRITPWGHLTEGGADVVDFLFATNKKKTLQPISEIASGGEISRFMLSLKAILSEHTVLPTVIFDEIDAGVSGEIAEKLGQVMRRMGHHMQVLSITHLPQIASLSSHQLLVEKVENDKEFVTHIRDLSEEDRISEIAGMLSGAERTAAAVEHARELLSLANKK